MRPGLIPAAALAEDALLRQGLAGVLPPALVGAALLALAWRVWRPRGSVPAAPSSAWGAPLAFGLGYAAAHAAIHGTAPPLSLELDVKETLAWAGIAVALVGLGLARGSAAGKLLAGALALALPWVLLDFQRGARWSTGVALLWTGLFGSVLALGGLSAEALARRLPGLLAPLLWMAVGTAAALSLVLGASGSLGQLAGALAAVAGAALVLALRQPRPGLAGGGAFAAWLLIGGLLLAGVYAAELPPGSAVLLALAPHAPWAALRRGGGAVATRRRGWGALALALLVLAAGLLLARLGAPPPSPYDEY